MSESHNNFITYAAIGLMGLFVLGGRVPTKIADAQGVTTNSAAPNPVTPTPTPTPSPSGQQKRNLQVTLTVSDLKEIKVKEGDAVTKGQILSDRTSDREPLEARAKQLDIAIKQMSLPDPGVANLPTSNYATQEVAIAKAKLNLKLLEQTPVPEFRFKVDELNQIHDKKVIEKKAQIQEEKTRAAMELNGAIASLEKARTEYQQQQYQHSLAALQHQTSQKRQQYEVASLLAQQQEVETKLKEVASVRAPYAGTIRRIKVLGQKDRDIQVEIFLVTDDARANVQPGGTTGSGGETQSREKILGEKAIAPQQPTTTPTEEWNVIDVHDGDTIRVRRGAEIKKIRFACIDAPELAQPGGIRSRDNLRSLINKAGKQVRLNIITTDRYGRSVAEVWAGDELAQSVQVGTGNAYTYKQYSKDCPSWNVVTAAEQQAIANRLGVWGNPNSVRPWDWRRRERQQNSR